VDRRLDLAAARLGVQGESVVGILGQTVHETARGIIDGWRGEVVEREEVALPAELDDPIADGLDTLPGRAGVGFDASDVVHGCGDSFGSVVHRRIIARRTVARTCRPALDCLSCDDRPLDD